MAPFWIPPTEDFHDNERHCGVAGNNLDSEVLSQTHPVKLPVSIPVEVTDGSAATHVRRWYMSSRQALTSQMVMHCICSTTRTILEPNSLVLISSSVNAETSVPGSMRLLLVLETMFMATMRTVSVAYVLMTIRIALSISSACGETNHGNQHEYIVKLELLEGAEE